MLTSAGTVSEKPTCRLSFRPSRLGEKRLGVTETRPKVRLTRSGALFSTSRPAGVRARTRTSYVPSRRLSPSTVTVCFPGRVQTRSTAVATVTPPASTTSTVTFAATVSR